MTPEQQAARDKAIEVMEWAVLRSKAEHGSNLRREMQVALDALHGQFTVNAREVTEGMEEGRPYTRFMLRIYEAMAAAGDLTRKP
jgi:hypothetical protein